MCVFSVFSLNPKPMRLVTFLKWFQKFEKIDYKDNPKFIHK